MYSKKCANSPDPLALLGFGGLCELCCFFEYVSGYDSLMVGFILVLFLWLIKWSQCKRYLMVEIVGSF